MVHKFDIWFDGGCRPNPGLGYGSYEVVGRTRQRRGEIYHVRMLREIYWQMHSQDAEFVAMVKAIHRLHTDIATGSIKSSWGNPVKAADSAVNIITDNMPLFNCMTSLPDAMTDVKQFLAQFKGWRIKWVRREEFLRRFDH